MAPEFANRLWEGAFPQPNEDYFGYSNLAGKLGKHNADPATNDLVNLVSYLESSTYMHNTLLRDTDFMSMAHSLEVRVPLIDHLLVEYAMGIPGKVKMDGENPKSLLTGAVKDLLPEEIINREKQGFIFPFREWMKDELKPMIEKALSRDTVEKRGIFDYQEVQKLWHSFLQTGQGWNRVWVLVVLELWCRKHLD